MGRLDGKVAIITGAARGQGEAEARLFVREGARVVLADVLDEAGQAVAAELGDAATYAHLDVREETEWTHVVADATQRFGGVDVLVNNAAVHWIRPLDEETVADLDRLLAINLRGPFLGIRAVTPSMRSRGGGAVVNISSTAGIRSYPGHTAYSMAKWGLRGLTRSAAIELAPGGIRVTCIAPGGVDTEMTRVLDVGRRPERQALGRMAAADEIAAVALFLASDEASFITGTDVIADGGGLLA
jgi:3alpha(or 20beta)-hydroxysteroid dehydrogenase